MTTTSDRATGVSVDRAVVVGGSVAGLAAALAAAPHASQVIVVERHATTGEGSIVPQGRLPHVLLAGGAAALDRLAPGFTDDLTRQGAVGADPGPRPVHWWAHGACRDHLPDVGIEAPLCTRSLVETTLRARARATAGIELRRGTVTGLEVEDGTVRGVRLDDGTTLAADIVVDASGRAARGERGIRARRLAMPSTSISGIESGRCRTPSNGRFSARSPTGLRSISRPGTRTGPCRRPSSAPWRRTGSSRLAPTR